MLISDDTPNVIVDSAKNPYTEKWGEVRGQAGCLVLGQGAGIASAVAAKNDVQVVNVNVNSVQEELRKQGVKLEA